MPFSQPCVCGDPLCRRCFPGREAVTIRYFPTRAAAEAVQRQVTDERTVVMAEHGPEGERYYLIHALGGPDYSPVYFLEDGTFGRADSPHEGDDDAARRVR